MSSRPLLDSVPGRRSGGEGHGMFKPRKAGSFSKMIQVVTPDWLTSSGAAYDTITILLNSDDAEERDHLTREWRDHKLEELSFVGTVGALLASCLSSTSSWPDVLTNGQDKPWTVRSLWFSGLIFALFAVVIAGIQNMRLHRLSAHRDGLRKIRSGLTSRRGPDGYYPRRFQVMAWEASQVFLIMSVAMMVSGVAVLVWHSTAYGPKKPESEGWWDENSKMAITFTAVLAFAMLILAASFTSLMGTDEDVQD